jgi:hypothetical protein
VVADLVKPLLWKLGREERFELSISRVRAERFKPDLATPLYFGDDGGIRTRDLLIENQAA